MSFDRYKKDLRQLIDTGHKLTATLAAEVYPDHPEVKKMTKEYRESLPRFSIAYQAWYSESLTLLEQVLPSRVDDFISYYAPPKNRKELTYGSYTISDYLRGLVKRDGVGKVTVPTSAAFEPFQQQLMIIESLERRFESSLYDIKTVLQADLFDDELDAAAELNKKGFQRGAGAMAGVVLEGHLRMVCAQHNVTVPKTAMLGKLNESLKESGVLDIPTWRFVQHLTDLRNLCDHKSSSEPTKENVSELIEGVRKITKTVF